MKEGHEELFLLGHFLASPTIHAFGDMWFIDYRHIDKNHPFLPPTPGGVL